MRNIIPYIPLLLLVLTLISFVYCDGRSADNQPDSFMSDILYSDVSTDTITTADAGEDTQPVYPDKLEVKYSREEKGTPLSKEEITQNTKKILQFLKKIKYFDYVLYTTHGVDASTGKKDYQFWFNEHFKKEGDTVTFYHPVNPNDGGHNLHIPMSRVLGDVIAAYMLTGDKIAGLAAEKLCKGMSASMLGMVYDENDPIKHLMARNVVTFNHTFLTHDGKKKAVDYSGWYSPYTRWNCYRFKYEHNPYWGEVWVTNMRSKDDVPHIFRVVPIIRYVSLYAKDENVKSACGEAAELLELFAKDIVDSDYRIRTKDENGKIFIPGYTDDPEVNKQQGDLASFIEYRDVVPKGECNARRSAELIGYHKQINEWCGRGEPNEYDEISFAINSYNRRICRYFHLSHIANSLINRDYKASRLLLDGLSERMEIEETMPESKMQTSKEDWMRDVALYLVQSHSFGFPINNEEARLIHNYYLKAVDEFSNWKYWDPWDPSILDGDLGSYRPPSCKGSGDTQECWFRVEDMAQIFENCWSPLVNPESAPLFDCDVVKDISKWE